jgi:hypothetical protein
MKRENSIQKSLYVQELSSVFKSNSRDKAHELSQPILKAMAGDRAFFELVLRSNFSDPDFLNQKRDYEKLLKLHLCDSPEFNLVMNIFPPVRPNETVSAKSIHHHQNLILSTINTFGPGYESIIFKKDIQINRSTREAAMEVDEIFFHENQQLRRIDSFVPHVVFFPEQVTATFALWSINKKRRIEYFKKSNLVERIKPSAVKAAHFIGLGDLLGLNDVSEVYFYVRDQKLYLLKHPLHHPPGTHEAFLSPIFRFLKETGFNDSDFLRKVKENEELYPVVKNYIERYLNGEEKYFTYENSHVMIPEENMTKNDILEALHYNPFKLPRINGSMPILNKFEAGF